MPVPAPSPVSRGEYEAILTGLGLDPFLTLQVTLNDTSIVAQVIAFDGDALVKNSPTDIVHNVTIEVQAS